MKKLAAGFVLMAGALGWLTQWAGSPAELGPITSLAPDDAARVTALPAWPDEAPGLPAPSGGGPAADSMAIIQAGPPEPWTLADRSPVTKGKLVAGWASALSSAAASVRVPADAGAAQPVSRPSRWSMAAAEPAPQRRQRAATAPSAQPRRSPADPPRGGALTSFRVAKSLGGLQDGRWNDWRDPENPVVANVHPAPSDVQTVAETPAAGELDPYAVVLRDRVKQAIEPTMETSLEQAQDPTWQGGTGGFEPLEVSDASDEQETAGGAAPQLFRQPAVTRSIPGVPEPSSTALLLGGVLSLCGYRRRRRPRG